MFVIPAINDSWLARRARCLLRTNLSAIKSRIWATFPCCRCFQRFRRVCSSFASSLSLATLALRVLGGKSWGAARKQRPIESQARDRTSKHSGPNKSRGVLNMRRIGVENCPYCGGLEVYISSPKTLWERIPTLFLLRFMRCHNCKRRHYRPVFLPAIRYQERASAPRKPVEGVPSQTEKRPA
jgi:hypothetical protein